MDVIAPAGHYLSTDPSREPAGPSTSRHAFPTSEPPLDGCPIGGAPLARLHTCHTRTPTRKRGYGHHGSQARLVSKQLLRGRSNVDSERTPGTCRAFRVLRPPRTDGQCSRSRAPVQVPAPECRSGPHERIASDFACLPPPGDDVHAQRAVLG